MPGRLYSTMTSASLSKNRDHVAMLTCDPGARDHLNFCKLGVLSRLKSRRVSKLYSLYQTWYYVPVILVILNGPGISQYVHVFFSNSS